MKRLRPNEARITSASGWGQEGEGGKIAQDGERQGDDEQCAQDFAGEELSDRLAPGFFHGEPEATGEQGGEAEDEEGIVTEGGGEVAMQQGVERAGHAAAGTVQAGEAVKLADRIKAVRGRVEEKNERGDAKAKDKEQDRGEP